MTRQWMCNPKIMCVSHINGEHKEIHDLIRKLKAKYSLTGYIENNCIEVKSIAKRHNELQKEAIRRGYNWNPTLLTEDDYDYSYLPLEEQEYVIDREASLKDLLQRCEKCRERYLRLEVRDFLFNYFSNLWELLDYISSPY